MKRFTLILAAIFGLLTAVNAQTYVGDIEGYFSTIPGEFTTNGHPFVVYSTSLGNDHYNLSIYKSDFTTHIEDINIECLPYLEVSTYVDFDNFTETDLIVTQNLFNSDDYFEYVEFVTFTINYDYYETTYIKAFNIVSSNGSTLWSFEAEEGFHCSYQIVKLDNNYYLLVVEHNIPQKSYGRNYDYEQHSRYHLYLISQGQGLTEVETELLISVFPSIVSRSQQITVELGEGNNATEVTVVNGLGQVIKRVPVQEGQRQIIIPAQGLNGGLNVVNTRTQQGQSSCKIIVQ